MNQTANELLNKILGVCVNINTSLSKGSTSSPAGENDKAKNTGIGSLGDILRGSTDNNKKLQSGIASIKDILGSIIAFNKVKMNTKKIDATAIALKGLFEVVVWIGSKERTIHNAVKLFDSLSDSLKGITSFTKSMSVFLLSIGGSILLMAFSLWTAGKILGTNPAGALTVMAGIILGLLGLMFLIGKAASYIAPGTETVKGIGKALMFLSGGLLAFVISLGLISLVLGTGAGIGGIAAAIGVIALVILGAVGAFALIGMAAAYIDKGTKVIEGMSLGLIMLAGSILIVALVATLISKLAGTSDKDESNGIFGKYGPMIKGLGVIGLVLLGAVGLFVAFDAMSAVIIPGIAIGFAVSAYLIFLSLSIVALAKSIKSVMTTLGSVDISKLSTVLSDMISGVISGVANGFAKGLSNGKTGVSGFVEGVKNMALIGPAMAVLMGMSVTISMFAWALTAFANLGNMRVIEGYDKVTGKPIFGSTVNIAGVGQTISATLSDFLVNLIKSTNQLTTKQARAIKKMGAALTGKNGILSGVVQFADVLKTFAQFGKNGEIGYVKLVPDGTDEHGQAKFKQVPDTVKIKTVVDNITSSFTQFVTSITDPSNINKFGINGVNKERIANLTEALMGSDAVTFLGITTSRKTIGLLTPIKMFADTLMTFGKFGKENKIPTFDENGMPTGSGILVSDIAGNIMAMLGSFSDSIAKDTTITTSISAAVKKLSEFDELIKKLGEMGAALDPLTKLSTGIGTLADNFARLTSSVDGLNVDKMGKISAVSASVVSSPGNSAGAMAQNITSTGSTSNSTTINNQSTVHNSTPAPVMAQQNMPDWSEFAQQIGNAIAAKMASEIKSGLFHFEFAGKTDGVLDIK
jgi:hypothetical protein